MEKDQIIIKGARENNLKNIDLTLPKNKLIVFTGVSGSGKSTLAFDTIYAEGQRRYLESLSSYARQFLGGNEKPDVDFKRLRRIIRVPQLEQLQRFMTIFGFSLLVLVLLIAQNIIQK